MAAILVPGRHVSAGAHDLRHRRVHAVLGRLQRGKPIAKAIRGAELRSVE